MPISFRRVSFEWPNGTAVFHDLSFTLKDHRTGLVGMNGVGKTTFASLVAGVLSPTQGEVAASSSVHLLRQAEERRSDEPAAVELAVLDVFANDRARRLIENLPIDRPTSSFSGGEWMRFRLARLAATAPGSFVILDEPTNHLDRVGRSCVIEFVRAWEGGLLVVSHDRELLESVDEILELTPQGLARVGGGWSDYDEFRRGERERLTQELGVAKRRRAEADSDRARRLARQEKRVARGRRKQLKGDMPRIAAGMYKRRAQENAGRVDRSTSSAADEAVARAHEAFQELKIDPVLAIKAVELARGRIPQERLLAEAIDLNVRVKGAAEWLWPQPLTFTWRGPRRIAIRGPNGSGKSTLLKLLFNESVVHNRVDIHGGVRRGSLRAAFLSQEFSADIRDSVLDLLRETSNLDEVELRNQLARFLLNRDLVERPIMSLSGGERLRADLARALIGTHPEVLVLDEPTNNLDLANVEYLENFLRDFPGALIVVSHDERFLAELEIEDELVLATI